ncbi:Uncharacterized protein YR821_0777 [Yersinia ruckeri]|nr:hypothetical protein yruck0001_32250 [Yersinia ruckeri ATCC 29473]QTD75708.1 Uncharacterized protein YR821_0777 [Yersinia ruckeri]
MTLILRYHNANYPYSFLSIKNNKNKILLSVLIHSLNKKHSLDISQVFTLAICALMVAVNKSMSFKTRIG